MNSRFYRKITLKALSFSRINYKFSIFIANLLNVNISFANSLWIHSFFPNSPSSWQFTTEPLGFSRKYSEKIICFANFLFQIFCVYREISKNSDVFLRIHYVLIWCYFEFTIYFRISLWIHLNSFRECTIDSLSVSCCETVVWIYYLYREYSENYSGVSRILYEFSWCLRIDFEFTIRLAN